MPPRVSVILALLLLAACGADPEPASTTGVPYTRDGAFDAASAPEDDSTPVASFLGMDDEADEEIRALLGGEGIESDAYGSLGYTVSVPRGDAPRARELLGQAIREGLRASLVELEEPQTR